MIFRRFSRHVREQNWFALLLDLVVVVVGIYIGLQADAWMSERKDRALERVYIERLLTDMEESIEAQKESIKDYEASIVATDYIAEIQRSGSFENIDEEKLIEGLNSIGWVPPLVTDMTSIRELQTTGNISLIQDVQIREAIGEFERSYLGVQASAAQSLGFATAAAPEYMSWSFMRPTKPGEHKAVPEEQDLTFGYIHFWDAERILQSSDGANITSWVSGWGKYDAAVRMQHHHETIAFRDLLKEKIDSFR